MNSRDKGARGEREWAEWLRTRGFNARRGAQNGVLDGMDVEGGFPGTRCEVKRVERLSIHEAMKQARRSADGLIPYIAHRRNREEWLVTVPADELIAFARAIVEQQDAGLPQEDRGSQPVHGHCRGTLCGGGDVHVGLRSAD